MEKNVIDPKIINEIRSKLHLAERRRACLPSLFYSKVSEPKISRWLSFLTDPGHFSFGREIINFFISKAGFEGLTSDSGINVFSEYQLGKTDPKDKKGIIDIYIETPYHHIGIELKLRAPETDGQTERYEHMLNAIQRLSGGNKEIACFYLKPSRNTNGHRSSAFVDVGFIELIGKLENLSKNVNDQREKVILDEFIYYLKTEQEFADDREVYSGGVEKILKKYDDWLFGKFKEMFKEEMPEKLSLVPIAPSEKRFKKYDGDSFGFLVLAREKYAQQWCENGFHFEILWSGSPYLTLVSEVSVEIHNEWRGTRVWKDFDYPHPIFRKRLSVDFSSDEKALDSIGKIIKLMSSPDFIAWGDRADECAERHMK